MKENDLDIKLTRPDRRGFFCLHGNAFIFLPVIWFVHEKDKNMAIMPNG